MTTLHMDVETCQNVQKTMVAQEEQMKSAIDNVTSQVSSTVGSAWIGNSATEFQGVYDDLQKRINVSLEELQTLANRLQAEINEWIAMAEKLG
jgi:uncharacterized protein YukE